LPPIDVVLLSHNHYDHFDAPTVAASRNSFWREVALPGLGELLMLSA
jgi:L-ascorbate metabolism protein UlaG (beta-lactamase superfamily)